MAKLQNLINIYKTLGQEVMGMFVSTCSVFVCSKEEIMEDEQLFL